MKPKIFALYLPQFYEIKENNEWWGEGYTDWLAVKGSKPLYEGHYQPHIPLNKYYYNLTNVDTIRWQAKTAKEYGVSGFCIYHYWSKGRQLMERPIDILYENSNIDIEYFISWANHDFKKSWFDGDGHMIWPQEYSEDDIKGHYKYFTKYFKDPRYLKINNKPVLKIFNIYSIPKFEEMMDSWNTFAKSDGFDGIYLIANKCNTGMKTAEMLNNKDVDAVFVFEPMNVRSNGSNEELVYTYKRRLKTWLLRKWNSISRNKIPERFDYQKANEIMLKRRSCGKQIYCIFPNWDNTPRYGGKGIVFSGSSPELFGYYARKFYERSIAEGNEILLVNAWNEWGESAHLEPDEKYSYSYLEQLKMLVK